MRHFGITINERQDGDYHRCTTCESKTMLVSPFSCNLERTPHGTA